MSKNKTAETEKDVMEFIADVENDKRRADAVALVELLSSVTGLEPKMWGPTIIGFGKYHYKYKSGHEGVAPLAAFSPRKDSLVLYFASEFEDKESLLSKLGKCRSSKACVYVKKLEDIELDVFQQMTQNSMNRTKELYPN
jgi:hypothetical protein